MWVRIWVQTDRSLDHGLSVSMIRPVRASKKIVGKTGLLYYPAWPKLNGGLN
jgi:hypothetical protein